MLHRAQGFLNYNTRYLLKVFSKQGIESRYEKYSKEVLSNHALAIALYDNLIDEPLNDRFKVLGVVCSTDKNFFNPEKIVFFDIDCEENIVIDFEKPFAQIPSLGIYQRNVSLGFNVALKKYISDKILEQTDAECVDKDKMDFKRQNGYENGN